MTIHVLVEGPSEQVLFERWARRALRGRASVRVHPHQGKGTLPADLAAPPERQRRGLLDQLPATLRGFAHSLSGGDAVMVVVDADGDDPTSLAETIRDAANEVAASLPVVVRLAVEETEAFYLGDLKGLRKAFPEADMKKAREYEPDSICGTWELFGEIVGDGGGNKVDWAEAMGPKLTTNPAASRSPSFRDLVKGLRSAVIRPPPAKRRKFRHVARSRRRTAKSRRA